MRAESFADVSHMLQDFTADFAGAAQKRLKKIRATYTDTDIEQLKSIAERALVASMTGHDDKMLKAITAQWVAIIAGDAEAVRLEMSNLLQESIEKLAGKMVSLAGKVLL